MLWEGRRLRDIVEADIQRLIEVGLEEHLQLEYKSALYPDGQAGRREFLQDICMFANTAGGILLIGIAERRNDDGQPTGTPDPAGVLGLDLPNPEAVLAAYDARVMEAIEERLSLESASITLQNGGRVLAFRIPNSTNKPHSVRHEGHIYFPARRERQRYPMNVREIKELVMRTTSRLQRAEEILNDSFQIVPRVNQPQLLIGIIPVFFEDFLVDVRNAGIRQAVGNFSRTNQPQYRDPTYSFDGLERHEEGGFIVRFHRNGLLDAAAALRLSPDRENLDLLDPRAIDLQLRRFVLRASGVYEAAMIGAPYLLAMMLRTDRPLAGVYAGADGFPYHTLPIDARSYLFPYAQVDDLAHVDSMIRPLCDQAHQLFGIEGSPYFGADGAWAGP